MLPPLTLIVCPVTNPASGLARKATAAATSAGFGAAAHPFRELPASIAAASSGVRV